MFVSRNIAFAILMGVIAAFAGCKSANPTHSSEAKELIFDQAYTYYVSPSLSSCTEDIKSTFREFPVLSNISLKAVDSESAADIKFVDYKRLTGSFRIEDDGTFTIGASSNFCGGKNEGVNNPFYPPVAMAMRMIEQQGNLKFAGNCGLRYQSLPYFEGAPDPTDAPRLWQVVNGSPDIASDDDDTISSAVSFVNMSRDLSIQLTYSTSKANMIFDFERLGSTGPLSKSEIVRGGRHPLIRSSINKDRIKTIGKLWDHVYHETEWQLYLIETQACSRFKFEQQ